MLSALHTCHVNENWAISLSMLIRTMSIITCQLLLWMYLVCYNIINVCGLYEQQSHYSKTLCIRT